MLSFPMLLIISEIHLSTAVYPNGILYYQDDCDDSDYNEWSWSGNYYGVSSSTNCPGIGYYCFGLLGADSIPNGRATKTFSTVGFWDIWISVDIHEMFDDTADLCNICFSHDAVNFIGCSPVDHQADETRIYVNIPQSIYSNNPYFTVRFELDAEITDKFYFRRFQIWGKPITDPPTDTPTPAPTLMPTPAPTTMPIPNPTVSPFTPFPTKNPSTNPTTNPSTNPSISPTNIPTNIPTHIPSLYPTLNTIITTNPTLYDLYPTQDTSVSTTVNNMSGKASDEIITTQSDPDISSAPFGNMNLITIAIVSISVIAICGCILFFICFIKKTKQLKTSRKELTTLKQNSTHKTHIQLQASSASNQNPNTPPTNEDNTLSNAQAINNNDNDLRQLIVENEIQLEGIIKVKDSEDMYMDENEEDDMYGTFTGVTKGNSKVTLGNTSTGGNTLANNTTHAIICDE